MNHIIWIGHCCMYLTNCNVGFSKTFSHIFFRLPFNWRTPIGYSVAFLLPLISTFAIDYSILPTACFTIGSYLLIRAVLKIIRNKIQISCGAIKNDKEMKEFFVDVITDISDVKELSPNSIEILCQEYFFTLRLLYNIYVRMMRAYTDIQQFAITGLFLWTIFTISSLILGIQSELVE